jgi:site-specific recombinase XerD
MAPRFSVDRYHHLASAVHTRQWLTMREQFGLIANTLDAYARSIDCYLSFLASRESTCETSTQADIAAWISQLRFRGSARFACFLSISWRKDCALAIQCPAEAPAP